jgi:hypothetical protein
MLENALGFNEPGGEIYVDAGRLRTVLRRSLAKNFAGYEPPPGNMERPPIFTVEVDAEGDAVVGAVAAATATGASSAGAGAGAGAGGGGGVGGNEAAKYPGRSAVDRRLRVFWKDDGAFFSGVVTSFDAITGRHTVTYDDGEVEEVALAEEETVQWLAGGKRSRGGDGGTAGRGPKRVR